MEIYTVSFFGHREISDIDEVEKRLEKIVRELILTKEYVEFLVGRDGNFDWTASATVRRVKRELDFGNCALVLVLPYMTAEFRSNEEGFYNYYDEVEICAVSESAYFKGAIRIRNRNMVERSELVVCCVEHNSGGAAQALRYAKQTKKKIINVAEKPPADLP